MSTIPPAQWKREEIAEHLAAYEAALHHGASQRDSASALGIPRSTLEYWRSRKDGIDAAPEVIAFFESPVGAAYLHRLVLAAHFTMSFVGNCGGRVVCQYLELAGLEQFVASSYGAQQRTSSEMETQLGVFGKEEKTRLAPQMLPKQIAACEDEAFYPQPCLVGIEPVSNFLLLEQFAANRKADTWTEAVEHAISGLPVEVIQVSSDEGSGIRAHTTNQLGVHHSPDLFHVQHEIVKGTSGSLASKLRQAEKLVVKAEHEVERQKEAKAAYWGNTRGPGRPPGFDKRIAQASQQEAEAKETLKQARDAQRQAQEAIQGISTSYHPYALESGAPKSTEEVAGELQGHFDVLEQVADTANLSERCRQKIRKAKRVVVQMVATMAFFWLTVRARIDALGLAPDVEEALYSRLMPAIYLFLAADNAQKADQKRTLRQTSSELLAPLLARDGPLRDLDDHDLQVVEQVATDCVQVFQRSSSCVEGRNGQVALRHHAMHRLRPGRLTALTTVHNYFLKRPDGTTAAERFFGAAPQDLFAWLLERVELPGRPAQKRSAPAPGEGLLQRGRTER